MKNLFIIALIIGIVWYTGTTVYGQINDYSKKNKAREEAAEKKIETPTVDIKEELTKTVTQLNLVNFEKIINSQSNYETAKQTILNNSISNQRWLQAYFYAVLKNFNNEVSASTVNTYFKENFNITIKGENVCLLNVLNCSDETSSQIIYKYNLIDDKYQLVEANKESAETVKKDIFSDVLLTVVPLDYQEANNTYTLTAITLKEWNNRLDSSDNGVNNYGVYLDEKIGYNYNSNTDSFYPDAPLPKNYQSTCASAKDCDFDYKSDFQKKMTENKVFPLTKEIYTFIKKDDRYVLTSYLKEKDINFRLNVNKIGEEKEKQQANLIRYLDYYVNDDAINNYNKESLDNNQKLGLYYYNNFFGWNNLKKYYKEVFDDDIKDDNLNYCTLVNNSSLEENKCLEFTYDVTTNKYIKTNNLEYRAQIKDPYTNYNEAIYEKVIDFKQEENQYILTKIKVYNEESISLQKSLPNALYNKDKTKIVEFDENLSRIESLKKYLVDIDTNYSSKYADKIHKYVYTFTKNDNNIFLEKIEIVAP